MTRGRCGLLLCIFSVLVVLSDSGCGPRSDGGPVPVEGTITIDGKPISDLIETEGRTDLGTVQFIPVSGTNTAFGRIDPSGTYELSTHEECDGAYPGEYKVAVNIEATPVGADVKTKSLFLPTPFGPTKKYASPETSGLTANVPEDSGGVSIDFDLAREPEEASTP